MDRIYVAVRARPLSLEDAKSSPWRISGNAILFSNHSTTFSFDRVFGEECKTVDVYEARTQGIVESAVGGFNGTVFAYGQTSSGKTHTMRGTPDEPGVIPLAVRDLFQTIQEDANREFLVRMSYMEIYNEEINDLLVPEHRKLQIHESLDRGIFVAGLREEIVTTPEQVLDLMEFGESHRHIGETNMNLYSSRSHTIFRAIIESREKTEDGDGKDSCDAVRVSVLNLVDLAGSERAAKTGAEGVRLKEGSHINKSLMTLGTVIKKLSEGAESQGGHVPYRDSKLTRILQPALGGNANTAIICNITLAQIHADETKSSLQFSNRALRVTNHACVNEILTDAALLKRQKREIEELRAKLLGSHSEHWEKEILNLRNTLLQSELEKERIVLELEEEKKAKAQRDKRLQEQAEKIANLSSMVLHSKREENTCINQKKRRQTWCPLSLPSGLVNDNSSQDCASAITKQSRAHFNEFLPSFDELLQETEAVTDEIPSGMCTPYDLENNEQQAGFHLPDACAFLHVTDRRKVHLKNTRLLMRIGEGIDCENVDEDELVGKFTVDQLNKSSYNGRKNLTARESEAILVIKQLQDQIKLLEMEKTAIQKNMDSVVELASEQSAAFEEKFNELHKELLGACEDAQMTCKELGSQKSLETSEEAKVILFPELAVEIDGIVLEFHHSRDTVDNVSAMVEDLCHNFSMLSKMFLELKMFASNDMQQLVSVIHCHEKVNTSMRMRVEELNSEKLLLDNQCINHKKEIEELKLELQHMEESMTKQNSQYNLEKDEHYSHILGLQKEISCLSSSSLAKEKETLRKDLEKTRLKLKETESKLRNALQDKSKLESEKAQVEREVKHLHGQKALLERDICKRDSKAIDFSKAKAHAGITEQKTQMDHQKLEYHFFEMEAEISSLKEDLLAVTEEKQEAISRCQITNLEMEDVASKLNTANSHLKLLKEEMDIMALRLSKSESCCERLKNSIDLISREKEEMMVQLTNSLLELEMEKSIRSTIERTSMEISDRVKVSDNEIAMLSSDLSKVTHELETFREQCGILTGKLALSEEHEREMSLAMSLEVSQLRANITQQKIDSDKCEEEKDDTSANNEKLRIVVFESEIIIENYEDKQLRKTKTVLTRIAGLESKMHDDTLSSNKEKTKLRMKLHGTQAKLTAYRGRYEDAVGEMRLMKKKYQEATVKYQERLASYGTEILRLKGKSTDITVDELLQTPDIAKSNEQLHGLNAQRVL